LSTTPPENLNLPVDYKTNLQNLTPRKGPQDVLDPNPAPVVIQRKGPQDALEIA
jgi:hypothetical protein